MGRSESCEKVGLRRGPWTSEEDKKLSDFIQLHGHGSWRTLPKHAGLQRCGKSCRLRWINYLRPDVKRGKFSSHEEQTIMQLHALLGNRWSTIASYLPYRTDNEIKNYWNTHIKKRLTKMGIDPATHKPQTNAKCSSAEIKKEARLRHMAQWETARLEAEARLVRNSRSFSYPYSYHSQLHFTAVLPPPLLPPPFAASVSGGFLTSTQNNIGYKSLKFPLVTSDGSGGNNSMLNDSEDLNNSSMYIDESLGLIIDLRPSDMMSDYEENQSYWNNVLNLVDSWPSEICEQIS